MSDEKNASNTAEGITEDIFTGRAPASGEWEWAEKTLAPALERAPEKPLGAATGTNLDERGRARFTTISGEAGAAAIHAGRSARRLELRAVPGLSGPAALHPRNSCHRLPRQARGRCVSFPASPRRRRPTSVTSTCWRTAADGLSVAFDLPTLMGYDSDHPFSEGEVGKCGVAIDSLEDMEILFHGIDLEETTVSMTINSPASVLWAMYLVVAEKQGADWKKLSGTLQNDILKEYIAQKEYIYPPAPSMRLVIDTFEFGAKFTPRFNTISISGYHIREAGSTALQELAFTIYDGVEYVEWARRRGLDVDEFGPRLSFFFNAHNDFFEEIAQVSGRPKNLVPADEGPLWGGRRAHPADALSYADGGRLAHRAAAADQYCAGGDTGAGRGAGWNASRCTRTRSTRRWPCPPPMRRASPCARSRSSPTNRAWPTPSTRWPARIFWNG